jgi:guanylate kinase
MGKGKLIILAGLSGIGKSPLAKALKRFYPELYHHAKMLVLYNSRNPRPGELDGVDYHFRKREEIRKLEGDARYVVMDVRGDLQALDLEVLKKDLREGDVFFEGNPFIGKLLATDDRLNEIEKISVFVAPLSMEEILYLKGMEQLDLPAMVTNIMQRKLLRRTRKQTGELSLKDLENIEKRAGSAYREMQMAHYFEHVIPNHDGEDSENWDAFYYPVGDARKALLAFAGLLKGEKPDLVEKWTEEVVE